MRGRRFRLEASPDVVLLSRWFSRTWVRCCRPTEWRRHQEQLDAASEVPLQEISSEVSDEEENDWTEEAYEKEMFLQREGERQRQRLKRLLQLLCLACVITVCVLVSTGAFVLAHFSGDCRLPPLHRQELLQTPLLPTLHVSTTGAVVLLSNSSVSNYTAFFRMIHYSTEMDHLVKAVSFSNSTGVSLAVAEADVMSKNVLNGYLCSGTDVEVVLPASAALKHLSLSSETLGSVSIGVGPQSPFFPFFESVEIVSVQGARVYGITSSSISIRSGVGGVMISNVLLHGRAPKIDILSRGGSVMLNLTHGGFSGMFEVHVSYGQIEVPGYVLCTSAPCPAMSYSQSEDAVEGHGSVFRGEVGNGEGRIKVFAPSGSDISLQLT